MVADQLLQCTFKDCVDVGIMVVDLCSDGGNNNLALLLKTNYMLFIITVHRVCGVSSQISTDQPTTGNNIRTSHLTNFKSFNMWPAYVASYRGSFIDVIVR